MDLWRSIDGIVEVELSSAEPEMALAAISYGDLEIWNLQKNNELVYSFRIRRRECNQLERICQKRGETLRYRKKLGLYWLFQRGFHRPTLLIGGMLLLALVLWLPTRVFFVCIDGNSKIPDRRILAAAEECGIVFGASRREVRSEKVKNALLSAVPELQWAGINTSGCTATISVREKAEQEQEEMNLEAASIEASRPGYILSCTVTRGTPFVKPGDAVTEGQLLISGYTDCGLCIRAERAEGEIFAQTSHALETVTLSEYIKKGEQQGIKRRVSLLLRKKRIFLWKDSGIWDVSCGRMYEEYYVTLPGGFRLPFALCVEKYICCDTSKAGDLEVDAAERLKAFAKAYLPQHMTAGRILRAVQSVTFEDDVYRLRGEYTCVEMIGRIRREQIGDTNGKDS